MVNQRLQVAVASSRVYRALLWRERSRQTKEHVEGTVHWHADTTLFSVLWTAELAMQLHLRRARSKGTTFWQMFFFIITYITRGNQRKPTLLIVGSVCETVDSEIKKRMSMFIIAAAKSSENCLYLFFAGKTCGLIMFLGEIPKPCWNHTGCWDGTAAVNFPAEGQKAQWEKCSFFFSLLQELVFFKFLNPAAF